MRRWLALLVVAIPAALVALLWTSPPSQAQPVTQPGLRSVGHNSSLGGSGTTASPLYVAAQSCGGGSAIQAIGSNGTPTCVATGTTYTAGDGLGESPAGTFNINYGTGLGLTGDILHVFLDGASCDPGEAVTAINSSGQGTCDAVGGTVTAGTNIDVSGSTVSVEPSVTLAGESNTDTLDVLNSATGQTASVRLVDITPSGTYNVSSGDLNEYGVYSASTATYSDCNLVEGSCTTQVNKYAFYANPTDGANNGTDVWSFYGANGTFYNAEAGGFGSTLNVTGNALFSANLQANGDVTLGDNAADQTEVGGDLTVGDDLDVQGDSTIGNASGDLLNIWATTTHQAPTTVQELRGTQIDVASVTGALTDWNPTGLATATTIRAATTGSTDLVSMAGGAADRKIQIANAGNSVIRVFHEYTTGTTAAMRFAFNQNYVYIKPAESMIFSYDATSSRWRQASGQHQVDGFYVVGSLITDGNVTLGNAASDLTTVSGDLVVNDTSTFYEGVTFGAGSSRVVAFNSMIKDNSGVPTVSACGTSPGTPTGGSNWWKVVVGTGGVTSCTFTFAADKGSTSICQADINNSTEYVYISAESDTAVTVSAKSGTTDISGDTISVRCLGDV